MPTKFVEFIIGWKILDSNSIIRQTEITYNLFVGISLNDIGNCQQCLPILGRIIDDEVIQIFIIT